MWMVLLLLTTRYPHTHKLDSTWSYDEEPVIRYIVYKHSVLPCWFSLRVVKQTKTVKLYSADKQAHQLWNVVPCSLKHCHLYHSSNVKFMSKIIQCDIIVCFAKCVIVLLWQINLLAWLKYLPRKEWVLNIQWKSGLGTLGNQNIAQAKRPLQLHVGDLSKFNVNG